MLRAHIVIIIANVVIYLLQASGGDILVHGFALWPIGGGFAPWQLLTYGFLHGSLLHVTLNMFAVYMFGGELERLWGERRFAVYYLTCVIAAGIVQTIVASGTGTVYPTVGASGGTFGLLLAFAIYFPHRRLLLLFPPIPLPAWLFVTLYGLLELFLGVTGSQSGVAHFAHLGGMIGGFILLKRWHKR
jgi:membrane associated rhomboid family serine protease